MNNFCLGPRSIRWSSSGGFLFLFFCLLVARSVCWDRFPCVKHSAPCVIIYSLWCVQTQSALLSLAAILHCVPHSICWDSLFFFLLLIKTLMKSQQLKETMSLLKLSSVWCKKQEVTELSRVLRINWIHIWPPPTYFLVILISIKGYGGLKTPWWDSPDGLLLILNERFLFLDTKHIECFACE